MQDYVERGVCRSVAQIKGSRKTLTQAKLLAKLKQK